MELDALVKLAKSSPQIALAIGILIVIWGCAWFVRNPEVKEFFKGGLSINIQHRLSVEDRAFFERLAAQEHKALLRYTISREDLELLEEMIVSRAGATRQRQPAYPPEASDVPKEPPLSRSQWFQSANKPETARTADMSVQK